MKNIHRLTNHPLQEGKVYFLDANIWQYYFVYSRRQNYLPSWCIDYAKFTESIIVGKIDCKVGTCFACISEATTVYFKELFGKNKSTKELKDFRKANPELYKAELLYIYYQVLYNYSVNLEKIVFAYDSAAITEEKDHWEELLLGMIDNLTFADFNDVLYAEICRNNGWIMVTNDGDFLFDDIQTLTMNPSLLNLSTR